MLTPIQKKHHAILQAYKTLVKVETNAYYTWNVEMFSFIKSLIGEVDTRKCKLNNNFATITKRWTNLLFYLAGIWQRLNHLQKPFYGHQRIHHKIQRVHFKSRKSKKKYVYCIILWIADNIQYPAHRGQVCIVHISS